MSEEKVKLLVGLGNPGQRYKWTRHNLGLHVIDRLVSTHLLEEKSKNPLAWWGKIKLGQQKIFVAKPLTFMNLSGKGVKWLSLYLKLSPLEILIIHDDLDLPWGKIKLVRGGSAAGHKGVASIHSLLGTQVIPRLKIGIGQPTSEDKINYVLSEFFPKEKEDLDIIVNQAKLAIETILKEGFDKAMSIFNAKSSCLEPHYKDI